jgi:beta-glucanase (GH16 family)
MMPENSTYGKLPASGEIDIMESRGNDGLYLNGGTDVITSSLQKLDSYWRTTATKAIRRNDYTKAFHTFGIEWSDKYLLTYMDSRLYGVLLL